ncbi:hypothetical protein D1159_10705 [Pseudoflavonifractor sp. 524-17]|uniref:hypothetical protein n=1 Tax=Pseudoflavonifractor sp. 524-17 TaxID=2304577 RepID=UPI00137A38E7|nr:hypothetical protein [Pseudoflavonifractor sp. 524-17]NCE65032.1 hypothetical protein [Pseudoflavonifractor sp. 524-17]
MATLRELSDAYLESAARLRIEIRLREAGLKDLPQDRRLTAEHDLRLLYQMLREAREVGEIARHYYDPPYWRSRKYVC